MRHHYQTPTLIGRNQLQAIHLAQPGDLNTTKGENAHRWASYIRVATPRKDRLVAQQFLNSVWHTKWFNRYQFGPK